MTNRTGKVLCLLALVLLSIGWCVGEWRARHTDSSVRGRLLRQAVHVAGTLDPAIVKDLSFTAADRGTPAFEFVRSQMTALGRYISSRGIYSMALRNGQLIFGPENYTEDDPMASPPGTVYEEPASDDMAIFETGKPVVFGPTADEYGTFICALAPVVDPGSGEVLMVVGIDALADDWKASLCTVRRQSILASLAAIGILLICAGAGYGWKRYLQGESGRPIRVSARRSLWRRVIPLAGTHTNTGLLISMGVLAVVFLGVVLAESWCWTRDHIDATADQQARLAVEFDKALRNYVGRHIRPEMEKRVEEGEFIPKAMSTSFVARSVFDSVREVFPDAILRFPSTNPRNPANRATPSEESLIRYFEEHPEADVWSGTMEFFEEGGKYFVCAVPRRFESGCLQCHGRPEDAPASLLDNYGPVAGFGRSVGEVSMDLAAVPVSAAYAASWAKVWLHMLTALVLCVFFLIGIGLLIRADARQRRQSQMAIEKERRFLRLVVDSIPGLVCVKSEDGRYVIANEALAKVCGTTVPNVEGKCDADFSPNSEEIRSRQRDNLEVLTTRKPKLIPERTITYPDGTQRWFTSTKVPLIDDDGACRRLLIVATDITERKRAEDLLLREKDFVDSAINSLPGIFYLVDEHGRFVRWNRNFEVVSGYSSEEMEKTHLLEFFSGDDKRLVGEAILEVFEAGESHVEADLITKDGSRIPYYFTGFRLVSENRPYLVGMAIDITERREAASKQDQLLQQLTATNQELKEFAYVVSHDLKAPLRGIRSLVDWLNADYTDQFDDQGREYLTLLASRAGRMQSLIDGILQYSRVGRTEQGSEPVDLNALLPEIVDSLGVPEHISICVEEDLPTIDVDATRITQVFQNLLSNAVKYMDKPQGRIDVACAQVDGFWQFSVADNGPGIDREHFDRVFKLFQTLSCQDEHKSTGVGLTLVKRIVEMYGGRVWIESDVGRGSTFFFTFPRKCDADAPDLRPVASTPCPVVQRRECRLCMYLLSLE